MGTKYSALKLLSLSLFTLWRSNQLTGTLINFRYAVWAIMFISQMPAQCGVTHPCTEHTIKSELYLGEKELRCCDCHFGASRQPQPKLWRSFFKSEINLITKDYITLRFKNTFHEKRLRNWNPRVPALPAGQAWGHMEP